MAALLRYGFGNDMWVCGSWGFLPMLLLCALVVNGLGLRLFEEGSDKFTSDPLVYAELGVCLDLTL